jgi:hypothetical protein
MKPAPLTEQPEMHHLPRLAPEFYRGFVVVQWTLTLERRATGWLDDLFHRLSANCCSTPLRVKACSGWACGWTVTSATP